MQELIPGNNLNYIAGFSVNKILLLLAASLILFVFSCKKDDDTHPIRDKLSIGVYKGLFVDSTAKSIESSYNNGQILNLDLNQNDTADLKFVIGMYGSPGMGVYYVSSLECLHNNIVLFGEFTRDTIFLKRNISYYSDEYNHYQVTANYFNCRQLDQQYDVFSIATNFHPLRLNKNDMLKRSDTFAADSISFIYSWNGWQSVNVSNDSVFVSSSHYDYGCHVLPYGENLYLGYKLTDTKERLGWIRFTLESATRITFKEYAIQL